MIKDMQREILFRGKSIETGEWIYGSLIGNDVIVGKIVEFDEDYFCTEFWNKVDPETVGQLVEISDKHGIEIFGGDIVKYFDPYSKTWHTRIVMWDWRFAGFGLFDKESEWCKESDWLKIKDIEIMGNIHDNQELI